MPHDDTRIALDLDVDAASYPTYRDIDPAREEVLYTSRPGLWTGIEVMRSRHWLKRLRVDLKKHAVLAHVTDGAEWQTRAGKQSYQGRVAAGSVELFSAGKEYDFTFSGAEHEDIYLMFDPDYLNRLAAENGEKTATAELQWRSSLHDPFIHHILQAFDAEIRAGCPGGRLLGDSLGMALGLHLLNRYGTVGAGVSSGMAGLSAGDLRRVQAYVRAHLETDLSVAEMAQSVNLSPFHFSRLFRSATHLSPYQYVIQERTEQAKCLLLRGEPLAHVARSVGFASQSHLNRHFKRAFGVTPGALRRAEHQRRNGQKDSTNREDI